MFTHEDIWTAIDRLAAANNYSTSGLAKRAGLDPTTFNKSKRITPDGKPRWPSTESIAKSLAAADATLMDLVGFIENAPISNEGTSPAIPHYEVSSSEIRRLNQKPLTTFVPVTPDSYAITIATAQWAPTHKKGTTLIVTPTQTPETDDVLFIETTDNEFFIMAFESEEDTSFSLRAIVLNEPDRRIQKADITRYAKILWASQ